MYGHQTHTQRVRGCKNGCGPMATVVDPDTKVQFETCHRDGSRGYDPGEFEAVSAHQLRLHGVQLSYTPQQAHQHFSQPQFHGGAHLLGGMFGGQQQQFQYGAGIQCPACGCQMQTLPYPGTNIQVERCTQGCGYLILDRGETEAIISEQLRAYGFQTPPPAQVVQHYAQPGANRGTYMNRPLFNRVSQGHGGHGAHHAPRHHYGHGSHSAASFSFGPFSVSF